MIDKKIFQQFLDSESKKAQAAKFILALLVVSGGAIVIAAAPGILKLASEFRYSKRLKKKQIQNSFFNLKKNKYIKASEKKNGQMVVTITDKAKIKLLQCSLGDLRIKTPEKWDGKWRVVMFDIPVTPRSNELARRSLREKMKEFGFIQLQKSAWVHPYECEEEILFIAEIYNVQRYIEILRADKLLHENIFLRKFNLHK